jgi:hypothetical protein
MVMDGADGGGCRGDVWLSRRHESLAFDVRSHASGRAFLFLQAGRQGPICFGYSSRMPFSNANPKSAFSSSVFYVLSRWGMTNFSVKKKKKETPVRGPVQKKKEKLYF